ncbi:class D sortase [Thermoflavimicrobium dichotomicum]|uniref:Sortase A n=1 Tax=Thermoflavimicrobium dichotomicum TaxID=46223 RepID=A0A1I3JUZ4_9BACL|nr:class D sortase [Thermoflavimicrobium dichotomicum]SFI63838.1 sortase A [Thermoflavimicrobium dichotomicum]
MIRKLAWLFIIAGGILLFYNAYHWWKEASLVDQDISAAETFLKDWANRTKHPTLDQGVPYPKKPKIGDKIGELIVPRLQSTLPIVEGTNEYALSKGVGRFIGGGTVLPGETGHVVLSGHRDTLFRNINKLQIGDKIYIRYSNKVFTYQIRKTWITHAEDRTVIVPIARPVLSLTTCYPFDYVGNAPERYILRAELIEIQQV